MRLPHFGELWTAAGAAVTTYTGFIGFQRGTEDGVAIGPALAPHGGPVAILWSVGLGVVGARPAFSRAAPTLDERGPDVSRTSEEVKGLQRE